MENDTSDKWQVAVISKNIVDPPSTFLDSDEETLPIQHQKHNTIHSELDGDILQPRIPSPPNSAFVQETNRKPDIISLSQPPNVNPSTNIATFAHEAEDPTNVQARIYMVDSGCDTNSNVSFKRSVIWLNNAEVHCHRHIWSIRPEWDDLPTGCSLANMSCQVCRLILPGMMSRRTGLQATIITGRRRMFLPCHHSVLSHQL